MTRPTIAADTVRLRANPDHVNRIVESASIYARGLGATPETLVFAGLSLALESLPPGARAARPGPRAIYLRARCDTSQAMRSNLFSLALAGKVWQ